MLLSTYIFLASNLAFSKAILAVLADEVLVDVVLSDVVLIAVFIRVPPDIVNGIKYC